MCHTPLIWLSLLCPFPLPDPSVSSPFPFNRLPSHPARWWPCLRRTRGLCGSAAPSAHAELLLCQEGVASLLWRQSQAGGEEPEWVGCTHIDDAPHGAGWQRERMAGQAGLWLSFMPDLTMRAHTMGTGVGE